MIPHPQRIQRNAYPVARGVSKYQTNSQGLSVHTLYQCFLTLPSVRVGKVCDASSDAS